VHSKSWCGYVKKQVLSRRAAARLELFMKTRKSACAYGPGGCDGLPLRQRTLPGVTTSLARRVLRLRPLVLLRSAGATMSRTGCYVGGPGPPPTPARQIKPSRPYQRPPSFVLAPPEGRLIGAGTSHDYVLRKRSGCCDPRRRSCRIEQEKVPGVFFAKSAGSVLRGTAACTTRPYLEGALPAVSLDATRTSSDLTFRASSAGVERATTSALAISGRA